MIDDRKRVLAPTFHHPKRTIRGLFSAGIEKELGRQPLATVAALVTAFAVIVAAAKYVFGLFSSITLTIGLPPAIEFRCSEVEYAETNCFRAAHPDLYHLTITAALDLRAIGEASREARITRATATIRKAPGIDHEIVLTALWSADFVPDQEFRRHQLTVTPLQGGQSRSQEMWFFPLAAPCGQNSRTDCSKAERVNFEDWGTFVSGLFGVDASRPVSDTAIQVEFRFDYLEGNTASSVSLPCSVEVSNTLLRMADPTNYSDKNVRSITGACVAQNAK